MSRRHLTAAQREARLVIMQTYRILVSWAPRMARFLSKRENAKEEREQLEQAHADWTNPDLRDVAVFVAIWIGLPLVVILDCFLIAAVAEYTARTFFGKMSVIVSIARILIPIVLVGVEAMLALMIDAARQHQSWDGSRREYETLCRIGLALVFVSPALVLATLFAGIDKLNFGFIVLALAQMCLAGALHLMVIKGGRQVREAAGYLIFKVKRNILLRREHSAERRYDDAARQVRVAYPVFEATIGEYAKALPEDGSVVRQLPADVDGVVRQLFGVSDNQQLCLPLENRPLLTVQRNQQQQAKE